MDPDLKFQDPEVLSGRINLNSLDLNCEIFHPNDVVIQNCQIFFIDCFELAEDVIHDDD